MSEEGPVLPAVTLAPQEGRPPAAVGGERDRSHMTLMAVSRLLAHMAEERSRPLVVDLPNDRVQATWSMSTGHRILCAWQGSAFSVAMNGLPKEVLCTHASGLELDRDAPWETAAAIAERCRIAGEAVICGPTSDAVLRGEKLRLVLLGWIASIEDRIWTPGLRASAATPWTPGILWVGDQGAAMDHALPSDLAVPRMQGIAIHDDDGEFVMGSVVAQDAPTDPLERLRAIAAYREDQSCA